MVDLYVEDIINFSNISLNECDRYFNAIVGHVEDILMNDEFNYLHKSFMEKYWTEFDDQDENKLIYMDIYSEYINIIEKHIEIELIKKLPNFDMNKFIHDIKSRQCDLDGEIFEILSTFTDFCVFKTMFLDYKAVKEGKTADFSTDLQVKKISFETPV